MEPIPISLSNTIWITQHGQHAAKINAMMNDII